VGILQGNEVQLEDNSVAPSHVQVEVPDSAGFFVVQNSDGNLDGEKAMDVDGGLVGATEAGKEEVLEMGRVQELKEKGVLLAAHGKKDKGVQMTGGGEGKKPGSYQRRPRDLGDRSEIKLKDTEKKRNREPEFPEEVVDHKKVTGAAVEVGDDELEDGKAGLLGLSL
jgi:hypothetical protein